MLLGMLSYCFGGGAAAAPARRPPRGSLRLDMHFFMNALRAAPWSFWSSAPNLHVANLSLALTAKDGVLGNIATGDCDQHRGNEGVSTHHSVP